jgi:hypothetical protein
MKIPLINLSSDLLRITRNHCPHWLLSKPLYCFIKDEYVILTWLAFRLSDAHLNVITIASSNLSALPHFAGKTFTSL